VRLAWFNGLLEGFFADFVYFCLLCTGLRPVGYVQASPTYFDVKIAEVGVITMSSSDIEEALDLLS
jgi:hypothetical protein